MDAGASPDDASTDLVSASAQDSAFLSLPLEIRYQVYDHFVHLNGRCITPNFLETMRDLTGVSQQIRREVYHLAAVVNTYHTWAGIFSDFTLKLYSTAVRFETLNPYLASYSAYNSTMTLTRKSSVRACNERMIQNLKDRIKRDEVPHQFRFWKVRVSVRNIHGRVRLVANLNFKEQEVRVCQTDTAHGNMHDLDPAGSLKQAFLDVVQEFAKEEGFNGVTVRDVSRFLEQVVMPDLEGFWTKKEMFEKLKEAEDYEQDEETSSGLT